MCEVAFMPTARLGVCLRVEGVFAVVCVRLLVRLRVQTKGKGAVTLWRIGDDKPSDW